MRLRTFLFVLGVLALRFALAVAPDPAGPTMIPALGQLVETARSGHALQIAPGVSVNRAGYDVGMFFYPSVALAVLPRWAPANLTLWQWLELAFLAAGAALMLAPGIPFRLGAGGAAALALAVAASGEHPLLDPFSFHYYGYWAPPLAALVALVWLLALPRVTRRVTTLVALYVGALALWRVDAGVVPWLAALALAAVAAIRHAAAWVRVADDRATTRRGLRTAGFCLAFVAIGQVPAVAVRVTLAAHQAATGVVHFAPGHSMGHMVWHNLYLSYGADELNPQRIEWDDAVGWLHAAESEPAMAALPGGGALTDLHDRALRDLYLRTAFEDPALWLRAAAIRAQALAGEIGWPWIGAALAALALAWGLAWCRDRALALPLPWGRVSLTFDGAPRVTGWGHGPLCVALMVAAAALPPLLYNASPWYARAARCVARAAPLLLAAGLAARRGAPRHATPETDRLVLRAAARVTAAGAAALFLFLAVGFAARALAGHPLVDTAPPPRDAATLHAAFDADPRTVRIALAGASSGDTSRLVDDLVHAHGSVAGGGRLLQFEAEQAAGTLRFAGWVRGHLLLAFRSARPWPLNGFLRGRGGWLVVAFQGARWQRYQVRIPPLMPGDEVLWMLPVLPRQPDPSVVNVSLREMGLALEDPGITLGQVLELKRQERW